MSTVPGHGHTLCRMPSIDWFKQPFAWVLAHSCVSFSKTLLRVNVRWVESGSRVIGLSMCLATPCLDCV